MNYRNMCEKTNTHFNVKAISDVAACLNIKLTNKEVTLNDQSWINIRPDWSIFPTNLGNIWIYLELYADDYMDFAYCYTSVVYILNFGPAFSRQIVDKYVYT